MAFKSSYSSEMTAPGQVDRSKLKSAAEISSLYGGINYDQAAIEGVYQKATDAEFAAKQKDYTNSANQYYNRLALSQNAQIDAGRKLRAGAVMSGASRAMTGVEEFRLQQAAQQATSLDNTTLVQQQRALSDLQAAAKTKATKDAMTYADLQKSGLMSTGANMYATDTQFDVGLLGARSMVDAANISAEGQGYVADNALKGTIYNSDKNLEGVKYNTDGTLAGTRYASDKSAAASGYSADKAYAGQVAYANGMVGAANAGAAGQVSSAQLYKEGQIESTRLAGLASVINSTPAGADANTFLNAYDQWASDPQGAAIEYAATQAPRNAIK